MGEEVDGEVEEAADRDGVARGRAGLQDAALLGRLVLHGRGGEQDVVRDEVARHQVHHLRRRVEGEVDDAAREQQREARRARVVPDEARQRAERRAADDRGPHDDRGEPEAEVVGRDELLREVLGEEVGAVEPELFAQPHDFGVGLVGGEAEDVLDAAVVVGERELVRREAAAGKQRVDLLGRGGAGGPVVVHVRRRDVNEAALRHVGHLLPEQQQVPRRHVRVGELHLRRQRPLVAELDRGRRVHDEVHPPVRQHRHQVRGVEAEAGGIDVPLHGADSIDHFRPGVPDGREQGMRRDQRPDAGPDLFGLRSGAPLPALAGQHHDLGDVGLAQERLERHHPHEAGAAGEQNAPAVEGAADRDGGVIVALARGGRGREGGVAPGAGEALDRGEAFIPRGGSPATGVRPRLVDSRQGV